MIYIVNIMYTHDLLQRSVQSVIIHALYYNVIIFITFDDKRYSEIMKFKYQFTIFNIYAI
jgi:hypothetical protein